MNMRQSFETSELVSRSALTSEMARRMGAEQKLAAYGVPEYPERGLTCFAYTHSELKELDCFMYAPAGCDPGDVELRYIYLRGIDISDRMTIGECRAIELAYLDSVHSEGEGAGDGLA